MSENESQGNEVPTNLTRVYDAKFYCGVQISSKTILGLVSDLSELIKLVEYVKEGKHDTIFFIDGDRDGFYLLHKHQCQTPPTVFSDFNELFKKFNVKTFPINVFVFT